MPSTILTSIGVKTNFHAKDIINKITDLLILKNIGQSGLIKKFGDKFRRLEVVADRMDIAIRINSILSIIASDGDENV